MERFDVVELRFVVHRSSFDERVCLKYFIIAPPIITLFLHGPRIKAFMHLYAHTYGLVIRARCHLKGGVLNDEIEFHQC